MIRIALVGLWILLAAFLFVNNRGHTVLVDNKGAEDGSFIAVELMKVSMNGEKGVEFFKNDRDKFTVVGARQRIRIEFTDGSVPLEREYTLPIGIDMFILSVPKMIAGIDPFVEEYFAPIAFSRDADSAPEDIFGNAAKAGGEFNPGESSVPVPMAP
ncbi:hypothetical protein MASR2M78_09220 [Treponema sp.]